MIIKQRSTPDYKRLAQTAILKALKIRKQGGYDLWDPVCVYDLADKLNIEVRFFDIPSMEGIFCGLANPTLIVSSLRPPGRQVFTCGHELGHYALGHGEKFDELIENRSAEHKFEPDEYQADLFASELLMTKSSVCRSFSLRGWNPATSTPEQIYVIARWLSVGYTTLVHHLCNSLQFITNNRCDKLLRHKLTTIRPNLLGSECKEDLIVVDYHWYGRAIDVQTSDIILLPSDINVCGSCVEVIETNSNKTLVRAITPGIGSVAAKNSNWSTYIRVVRKNYVGRGKFRFEEELKDNE